MVNPVLWFTVAGVLLALAGCVLTFGEDKDSHTTIKCICVAAVVVAILGVITLAIETRWEGQEAAAVRKDLRTQGYEVGEEFEIDLRRSTYYLDAIGPNGCLYSLRVTELGRKWRVTSQVLAPSNKQPLNCQK